MYFYISIRGNSDHSQYESVSLIKSLLNKRSELMEDGDRNYKNTPHFPWVRVVIANCDSSGNYPGGFAQNVSEANLIEMICLDDDVVENEKSYIDLAYEGSNGAELGSRQFHGR